MIISDHALSHSGVATQSKYLIDGLIEKNKNIKIIQLGAGIKHESLETVKVSDNFYIKPINGFGNKELLRSILLNEKPDALIIFSDPRFFEWLFKIEDEIRKVCPILWWHVWDNEPYPEFNEWMYNSVDALNCHSYLTYKLCNKNNISHAEFIPHALPLNFHYRLNNSIIKKEKERILSKERSNNFVCLWMNRNCARKRPGDVLVSWANFLKKIKKSDRNKVTLLMHTNPEDSAGQNLYSVANNLQILDTVAFSTQKLTTEYINILHNISDVCLNISYNEGFGLTTLESMQVGTPIIAAKTGGLYRQVIDFRDSSENGVALEPKTRELAGNQNIPFIYKDYVSVEDAAHALVKIFKMDKLSYKKISKKVEMYAKECFSYEETINKWYRSINKTIQNHKNKENLELIEI